MSEMWLDLQEGFYILFGPFIASIVLPIFLGAGVFLAVLMVFARYWRPKEQIEVVISDQDRDE